MKKELLNKFLINQCTHKELVEVVAWFRNAFNPEVKNLIMEDWTRFELESSDSSNDLRFNQLLDKIHHKINIKTTPVKYKNKHIAFSINWLTKVAAILLIPVLSMLLYTISTDSFSPSYVDMVVDSLKVATPTGATTEITLSDGTKVHLNYGSKIEYPRVFSKNVRELKLTGEGFFEVAHNPSKPFIVQAGGLDIKALGTKFNVLAYPDRKAVSTTLVEGKVVLDQINEDGTRTQIGTMIPGQHVEFNKGTKEIISISGNTQKYTGWKDGLLIFESSGIDEVAERLKRKFDVDFKISNAIEDFSYTVTFINEPLIQILDLMVETTPIKYEILPRQKLADGTYTKQTIIINKR